MFNLKVLLKQNSKIIKAKFKLNMKNADFNAFIQGVY